MTESRDEGAGNVIGGAGTLITKTGNNNYCRGTENSAERAGNIVERSSSSRWKTTPEI
jgi:hypothetical protein